MAGIGIKLNKVYRHRSLTMHLYGFGYSTMITVVPMFVVIGAILVSQLILRFESVGYMQRELFADTILYIFIFSVLFTSPLNAVLSKYISDVIFEERYDDIIPCFHLGMGIVMTFGVLFGIPFCLIEHFVGGVPVYYVFTGYCGFTALMLVFYSMLYLSITKSYGKISLFFTIGMAAAVLLSWMFYKLAGLSITYSILLGMTIGFIIIASLEIALIKSYFRRNSGNYRPVFGYLKKHWRMIFINTLYTLGLFIHNFVFWTTPLRSVLVKTFVTCMPYDMATCLAMFTNISATIIFIVNVELHFRDRYRRYFEAVIGGRGHDIRNAKMRMFRQLSTEIMSLIRLQFIISVVVFLICITTLPMLGIGGLTMRIYPCLCVGYFVLFVMYSEILFLYYFNDVNGAMLTAGIFCGVTLIVSFIATHLPDIWYGIGLVAGSVVAFSIAYFRLRYMEKHIENQVFCRGDIIDRADGEKPSAVVYSRAAAENGPENSGAGNK
ncbi:MAG: exopolysaccharide Pel transporter PelG [Clostridia bacterium]|nr:exopolysaccharide Pel transporter PelG [Clostridia bacterium]